MLAPVAKQAQASVRRIFFIQSSALHYCMYVLVSNNSMHALQAALEKLDLQPAPPPRPMRINKTSAYLKGWVFVLPWLDACTREV